MAFSTSSIWRALCLTSLLVPGALSDSDRCGSTRNEQVDELREIFDSFGLPYRQPRRAWMALAADILYGGLNCEEQGPEMQCPNQPDVTCESLMKSVISTSSPSQRGKRDATFPQQQQERQERRDHQRFTQEHEQHHLQQELRPPGKKSQTKPTSPQVDLFHWLPPHPQTNWWLLQDRLMHQRHMSDFSASDSLPPSIQQSHVRHINSRLNSGGHQSASDVGRLDQNTFKSPDIYGSSKSRKDDSDANVENAKTETGATATRVWRISVDETSDDAPQLSQLSSNEEESEIKRTEGTVTGTSELPRAVTTATSAQTDRQFLFEDIALVTSASTNPSTPTEFLPKDPAAQESTTQDLKAKTSELETSTADEKSKPNQSERYNVNEEDTFNPVSPKAPATQLRGGHSSARRVHAAEQGMTEGFTHEQTDLSSSPVPPTEDAPTQPVHNLLLPRSGYRRADEVDILPILGSERQPSIQTQKPVPHPPEDGFESVTASESLTTTLPASIEIAQKTSANVDLRDTSTTTGSQNKGPTLHAQNPLSALGQLGDSLFPFTRSVTERPRTPLRPDGFRIPTEMHSFDDSFQTPEIPGWEQAMLQNSKDGNFNTGAGKHVKKPPSAAAGAEKPNTGDAGGSLHSITDKPHRQKIDKYFATEFTTRAPIHSHSSHAEGSTHRPEHPNNWPSSWSSHRNDSWASSQEHRAELTEFNTSNFTSFALRLLFAALRMAVSPCRAEYRHTRGWLDSNCRMYSRTHGSRAALQTITSTLEKHLAILLKRWDFSKVFLRPQNGIAQALVQQQQRVEPVDSPCPADFVDEIFRTFGVRQTICAEGHAAITVEGLDALLNTSRSGGCRKQDVQDGDPEGRSLWSWSARPRNSYDRNSPKSTSNRFTARQLIDIVLPGNHSTEQPLNAEQFYQLCPALLQQILLAPKIEDDVPMATVASTELQSEITNVDEMPPASPIQSYGLGTAAVTAITMCSLMAAVTVKMCHSASQHYAMAAMLALAVGSLAGDAVLHLLPQGLHMQSSNTSARVYYLPGDLSVSHTRLKALALLASLYILYLLELLTTRRSSSGHSHSPPDKQETYVKDVTTRESSCDMPMSSLAAEMHEVPSMHESEASRSSQSVKIEVGDFAATSQDLVLMIMVGDAAHNIADGLAIGASFAHNVPLGLSTAIAVVCHEIPHELGDFAVLISTGISLKRALFINLMSSLLEYVGLYIGLAIGAGAEAREWMFLIVAGMFTYISLANLTPEILRYYRHFRNAKMFIVQQLGILSGFAVMFCLVLFEKKLRL